MIIRIPNWHPTPLNKLISGHHMAAHKRKKADKAIILCYTMHLPKAVKKRHVGLEVVFGKGERACDPDAYWKSLLDALVAANMLVNDSHKWVSYDCPTYTRGPMPMTIITITDVE